MIVEFDPAKDAINKRKHGISLERAESFDFETVLLVVDDREDYGEAVLARFHIEGRDPSGHQPSKGDQT